MPRIPSTENTEVLTIRISQKLKDKLNGLAKKGKYGDSASAVVRYMIDYLYRR
jgi:Arc/MetJ-type ribon-helix-helix transcriptional regulator